MRYSQYPSFSDHWRHREAHASFVQAIRDCASGQEVVALVEQELARAREWMFQRPRHRTVLHTDVWILAVREATHLDEALVLRALDHPRAVWKLAERGDLTAPLALLAGQTLGERLLAGLGKRWGVAEVQVAGLRALANHGVLRGANPGVRALWKVARLRRRDSTEPQKQPVPDAERTLLCVPDLPSEILDDLAGRLPETLALKVLRHPSATAETGRRLVERYAGRPHLLRELLIECAVRFSGEGFAWFADRLIEVSPGDLLDLLEQGARRPIPDGSSPGAGREQGPPRPAGPSSLPGGERQLPRDQMARLLGHADPGVRLRALGALKHLASLRRPAQEEEQALPVGTALAQLPGREASSVAPGGASSSQPTDPSQADVRRRMGQPRHAGP
jgi:hypothetical protein